MLQNLQCLYQLQTGQCERQHHNLNEKKNIFNFYKYVAIEHSQKVSD